MRSIFRSPAAQKDSQTLKQMYINYFNKVHRKNIADQGSLWWSGEVTPDRPRELLAPPLLGYPS